MNPTICRSFPSPCKRISVAHTLSLAPTIKRRFLSSSSTIVFNGRLSRGTLSLSPSDASSASKCGSLRINNIRCVSDASIEATEADHTITSSRDTTLANYACSSDNFLSKTSTNQPIIDLNFLAAKCVNGSWSSSVPSVKSIYDAIESLHGTTGTDIQSQRNISDQCYYLAAWTKINKVLPDNKCRPTLSATITLHQVALAIVSYNGITRVLNAMDAHPNNIEIQENGCMVLGNILTILYRRMTCNVLSYEKSLGNNTIHLGNSIFRQIIHAMRNHPGNVTVHCAAIPALYQYYLSVFLFQPNDANLEYQNIVLQSALEMFLPSQVKKILRETTFLAERLFANSFETNQKI